MCSTFVAGRQHELEALTDSTMYMPYGTSLRMGRLGYQSDAQASLAVSYNSLEGYAASLQDALSRPYPAYEKVGIRNPGGDYNQLADTLLQIENEFYGTIRPKRVIRPGERPLHALRERGVEYIEVRLMDLDPFETVGINTQTMRFIDVFLLHCLLSSSPPDTPAEIAELKHNQHQTAARGRAPGAMLKRRGGEVTLVDWGGELLAQCAPIAAVLDDEFGGTLYRDALAAAALGLANAETLPSACVLVAMAQDFDNSFVQFAKAQSLKTQAALQSLPLTDQQLARFTEMSQHSIEAQKEIEAADTLPFEQYREHYMSAECLDVRVREAVHA